MVRELEGEQEWRYNHGNQIFKKELVVRLGNALEQLKSIKTVN